MGAATTISANKTEFLFSISNLSCLQFRNPLKDFESRLKHIWWEQEYRQSEQCLSDDRTQKVLDHEEIETLQEQRGGPHWDNKKRADITVWAITTLIVGGEKNKTK